MSKFIRIGTRGSQLALWQANFVQSELEKNNPDVSFERVIIKTTGDRDQKSSLTQIGGQGVFTKTIEDALLNKEIDVAVHSLKDLPSQETAGLVLGAVPQRGFVEDVLVTENGTTLQQLAQGARIATGSIRRQSQLLALRPDLEIKDLRGNIDTRLRKLAEEDLDAIIMAKAAIVRLELDQVKYSEFKVDDMVPSVSQGAIGIQIRQGDEETLSAVHKMNHAPTFQAVMAERSLLRTLDSGCQFPVGAFAQVVSDEVLDIIGYVGSVDGKTIIKERLAGSPEQAELLGERLAEILIDKGAKDVLKELS